MKTKKPKKKSITQLKKEADRVFSLFIRQRDGNQCFSCGTRSIGQAMQCGHYIPRQHLNTRYDEQNNNVQCCQCNVFKKGNMPSYTLKLMEKYGDDIIKKLYERGQVIRQFKRADYEQLIEYYKSKLC